MRVKDYCHLLKFRGYKPVNLNRKICIFKKTHLFNEVICYVEKDSHCKGKSITFNISNTNKLPKNDEELKLSKLDKNYLIKEMIKICDCFEQLRMLKSPKHIYF